MNAADADALGRAHACYRQGRLHQAFDLYQRLANAGHAESQVFVAWMLSQGIGCEKDEVAAARHFAHAAALGHSAGCFYHGRWLAKAGDHASAYRLFLRGADQGHLPSTFRVGHSLARGKGVAVDLRRAYEVLGKAAVRGHAYALREIAVQDLRGGRGLLWRPIGLVGFAAALLWGVAMSIVNKDSDLLRG